MLFLVRLDYVYIVKMEPINRECLQLNAVTFPSHRRRS